MKRLFTILACSLAALSVLVSCEPKKTPDGKCEITAFSLTSALNSALASDIVGTIDASAKTITLVIPSSVTATSFIPTFSVTEYDVVTVGGKTLTSGETSITVADGTTIAVSDDISALNANYTMVVKMNDELAELTGVTFKKADNAALTDDVSPEAIAPEMVVRVPGAAFKQELVMTVSAGFNDAIKVNNEAVESGSSIKVDTSFPIDIAVTDEVAGKTERYVVKVGKILEVVVTPLGTYAEGTINDFTMTINPTDNLPYFAYTRKLDGESNNGVSIAKWNGSAFALVGKTGIADASARSASAPKVAFAKDGTVYAFYTAGDVASKPTVRKLESDWTIVGTAGITPQNYGTSYPHAFFVHPANSQPAFVWSGNSKNTDSYRKMNYAFWNGTAWSSTVETKDVPEYVTGTENAFYASCYAIVNDKVFLATAFNQCGYHIHEVGADGSLTPVVVNYVPGDSPHGLPSFIQIVAGKDGALYFFGADRGAGAMQLYSVDQSAKTLKSYGAGIPVEIGSSGGISIGSAIGVNPVDGLTIAAYDVKKDQKPVIAYLDDSFQWAPFTVDPATASDTTIQVAYSQDGKGYIAYETADGIVLYSVGLEADILPE